MQVILSWDEYQELLNKPQEANDKLAKVEFELKTLKRKYAQLDAECFERGVELHKYKELWRKADDENYHLRQEATKKEEK